MKQNAITKWITNYNDWSPDILKLSEQWATAKRKFVEDELDVQNLEVRDTQNLAYVTQTTLSIDDTFSVVQALQKKFPAIQGPHKEDICYATTNRQLAVKEIANKIDALLVVGAPNSSNSKRLVEVGKRAGCKYSQLVQRASEIDLRALEGIENLGITAGASAPEVLIEKLLILSERHILLM